ncbi:MAG: transcriptional regulator with XRE-family HTH domain [Pseudorhodobacter sp.]|jgi:transcriptional regulator with XRE-family HTH domain
MTLPEFKKLDSADRPKAAHVGVTLRIRRRQLDLTLDDVATRAGCSESMLCKIETGKVNPSITLLRRLAQALSVNIAALFDDQSVPEIVQRAGERPRLNDGSLSHGDGVVLERVIPHLTGVTLQADIHEVAPGGASDGLISHQGEEMGYVLEGLVELIVDDQRWRLEPGDSFYFSSERPHGYRNIGRTLARILWVNTPPTF